MYYSDKSENKPRGGVYFQVSDIVILITIFARTIRNILLVYFFQELIFISFNKFIVSEML